MSETEGMRNGAEFDQGGPTALALRLQPGDLGNAFADPLMMNQLWRAAQILAQTRIVPEHFQGKVADVFVVLAMARRRNEDPLELLQNIYLVHGRPAWMTEFLIARCRAVGLDLRWVVERRTGTLKVPPASRGRNPHKGGVIPDLSVTCFVKGDDDPDRRATISSGDALSAGWTDNEQYLFNVERMLRWRTASWWVAQYASHIKHGLLVKEELETADAVEFVDVTPPESTPKRGSAALKEKLGGVVQSAEQVTSGSHVAGSSPATPTSPSPSPTPSQHVDPAKADGPAEPPKEPPKADPEAARREQLWARIQEWEKHTGAADLDRFRAEADIIRLSKKAPIEKLERYLLIFETPRERADLEAQIKKMWATLGDDMFLSLLDELQVPEDRRELKDMELGDLRLLWRELKREVDDLPPEA